ncbi:hypothetical protein FRB90_003796, partial [Tulasnella sp. 427]
QGLPEGLQSTLEGVPILDSISLGEEAAYFWKAKDNEGRSEFSSKAFDQYPKLKDISEPILWVAFGPNGSFVCHTASGPIASDPAMLRDADEPSKKAEKLPDTPTSEDASPVERKVQFEETVETVEDPQPEEEELPKRNLRTATFGHEGSWALVEIDGTVMCHDLHPDVEQKLKEKPVRMIRESIISPETEFAYPEVWKIYKSGEHIKWVSFGPDGRYVVQTIKQVYAWQQSTLIRNYGGDPPLQVPTLCASFGYGGSWVVVEGDDGTVRTHGVSRAIRDAIMKKNVRHIHLSQTDPDQYYIEYRDHTAAWALPASWHESVQSVEKLIFEKQDESSSQPSPPTSSGLSSGAGSSLSASSASAPDPFTLGSVRCLTGLVHRCVEPVSARGGYSDVWRGKLKLEAESEEEDVAMKVLRAVRMSNRAGLSLTLTERMRKRMNRETEIWSRLNHPNVVPLRGFALQEDGTPMIISPWFDHGDVHFYLEDFPDADRKKIVRQVVDGLVYLHAQDPPVVHGDLKGGNVLINKEGDAALCDFGLSTLLMVNPATMTMSTVGVGTVRWCAPELLTSNVPEKSPASDVWAFAGLTLEILTGRIPFHTCTNDAKVIHDIATGKIPAREDYPELHPGCGIWPILESCWNQEPSERPTMETLKPMIYDDRNFTPN